MLEPLQGCHRVGVVPADPQDLVPGVLGLVGVLQQTLPYARGLLGEREAAVVIARAIHLAPQRHEHVLMPLRLAQAREPTVGGEVVSREREQLLVGVGGFTRLAQHLGEDSSPPTEELGGVARIDRFVDQPTIVRDQLRPVAGTLDQRFEWIEDRGARGIARGAAQTTERRGSLAELLLEHGGRAAQELGACARIVFGVVPQRLVQRNQAAQRVVLTELGSRRVERVDSCADLDVQLRAPRGQRHGLCDVLERALPILHSPVAERCGP